MFEYGYEESAIGFSLSYNTSIERAKELMPRYAFGKEPGENKFLREIQVWFDVLIPRNVYQEFDQYKISTTTLSESTIHTLCKKELTQENFEYPIFDSTLSQMNELISKYKIEKDIILYLNG